MNNAKPILLSIAISTLFLSLFIHNVEWHELSSEILKADTLILSLSVVVKLIGFVLMAYRTKTILSPLFSFNLRTSFTSIAIAFTGNNLLPLRMGELLKAKFLSTLSNLSFSTCLPVLVFERLLDFMCLIILVIVSTPLIADTTLNLTGAYVLFSVLILFYLLLRQIALHPNSSIRLFNLILGKFPLLISTRLSPVIGSAVLAINQIHSPRKLATALIFSIGYWLTQLISIHIWIVAFKLEVPWYAPSVILIFIALGNFFPSAPSNIGTYHYFTMLALAILGVENNQAASVAIVGHAISIIPYTLAFAPICLANWPRRSTKNVTF
ncbi:MAG: flippase-like domain-containing protein [Gammaproteobacteria bacterium]|nr:flippase-like domain-containing protein [Gammaproteobacteria bacterium]